MSMFKEEGITQGHESQEIGVTLEFVIKGYTSNYKNNC